MRDGNRMLGGRAALSACVVDCVPVVAVSVDTVDLLSQGLVLPYMCIRSTHRGTRK